MKDEPMKKHTTFRIGGPADYFVTPESREEIQAIVELCKKEEIPYSVIGNGSNLLVGDKGYRGVILQIFKKMNQIRVEENKDLCRSRRTSVEDCGNSIVRISDRL